MCSGSCDLARTGLGVGSPPHEGGWEGQQGGATPGGRRGRAGKRGFETPTPLYLGLRDGEQRAMRWENIDLQHGLLSVVETIDHKTHDRKEGTKNGGGI